MALRQEQDGRVPWRSWPPHRTGEAMHGGVRLAWRLWEREAPTVLLMTSLHSFSVT